VGGGCEAEMKGLLRIDLIENVWWPKLDYSVERVQITVQMCIAQMHAWSFEGRIPTTLLGS